MSSASSTVREIDREALLRVVEPICFAHGVEIFDVEFRPESHGWVLRLYVEKQGASALRLSVRDAAVNLELCAAVSRDVSTALDVADLVPRAYWLEVSSPGLERPLRREQDFIRFAGQRAKLKLREAVTGVGQRVIVGALAGVSDARVHVREGARAYEIALSNIESARLVFEFGGALRPRAIARETQHRKH
jgi:ribosome maturation factor RimP